MLFSQGSLSLPTEAGYPVLSSSCSCAIHSFDILHALELMLHLIPGQNKVIAARAQIRIRIHIQLQHLWPWQPFLFTSAALRSLFEHLFMVHNYLPVEVSAQY